MNIDNDIAFPDDVAGALGTSLAPITPSADVRQRILSTISSLPQERSTGLRSVPNLAADGSAHPDNLVPLRSRRTRLIRNLSQVAAAVVLIGAGVGIGRWSTLDSMEHTSNFAELNQAQDVVRISDKMPDGHVVTLMWSEEMKMAAVTMPPELQAPPGHSLKCGFATATRYAMLEHTSQVIPDRSRLSMSCQKTAMNSS